MNSRTYQIGRSKITLLFGDITASKCEVLLSSDDYMLSMGGGVSAAIRRAGGRRVAVDASKMVPAEVGSVVVSTAGDHPAKYILHAITLGSQLTDLPADAIVRQTCRRVMDLLPALGCSSVALPAIGAGRAGIPYETVASEMAGTLAQFLIDSKKPYNVELYLMDRFGTPDDFFVFFEEFASRKLGLSATSDSTSIGTLASGSQDAGYGCESDRRSRAAPPGLPHAAPSRCATKPDRS